MCFTSSEKIVKSYILIANALSRIIEIPERKKKVNIIANKSILHLKREKTVGKNPKKQKL